jgi:methionyl aminopeptidase
VNYEVVHGVPGKRVLVDGDIVSLDTGIIYRNYYIDAAITVGVGAISPTLKTLLHVAHSALYVGIEKAVIDFHVSDISSAVQDYVESNDMTVVRDYVGHGIGTELHEDPEVPNYGQPHKGPRLKEGMVLAIEPMVNLGSWQTEVLEDKWTVVTKDRKPSAHFEHTVAITKQGPRILTE